MIKLKPKKITVAEQIEQMKTLQPNFYVQRKKTRRTNHKGLFTFNEAVWIGKVRPTPLSRSYTVKIEFKFPLHPRITIISPKLELADGAKKLPHVYIGDKLCLYTPKKGEWHSGLSIATTIIPWISTWLYYYEIWLITGEWLGDEDDPYHEKNL